MVQRKAVNALGYTGKAVPQIRPGSNPHASFAKDSLSSVPFGADPPAMLGSQPFSFPLVLSSLLVVQPDFPQHKGTACPFPFFRCFNLEYCQDPCEGQQEVQDMP